MNDFKKALDIVQQLIMTDNKADWQTLQYEKCNLAKLWIITTTIIIQIKSGFKLSQILKMQIDELTLHKAAIIGGIGICRYSKQVPLATSAS